MHRTQSAWRTSDVLGFSAHWTWIWCVFWSSLFYQEGERASIAKAAKLLSITEVPSLEPLWLFSLLANVVTIALLLLVVRTRNPLANIQFLAQIAGALSTLGTLALSHMSALAPDELFVTLYVLGAIATGVGSGIIVVLWSESISSMGPRRIIQCSVMASIIGAGAYFIILQLPVPIAQTVVAILPCLSVVFLMHFSRDLPTLPAPNRNIHVKTLPPWGMIAVAAFFGFSFGIMKGAMAPIENDWIVIRDLLNIAAIVAGSIAIYLTISVYKMDFDHLTYQVALPLMAAGFLFLSLHEPLNVIGTAVHQLGYQYFYIVLWALWPVLSARSATPSGWMACWGMLAIQVGQLFGSVIAVEAAAFFQEESNMAMMSALLIFCILLVALFVLGRGSAVTGWGSIRPIDENEESPVESAVMRIAQRCHLSPRETEVLSLLAKGRNRAYIREELTIGDETVKSHIKNIYRKLDVHSQQQLIDLIEEEEGLQTTAMEIPKTLGHHPEQAV